MGRDENWNAGTIDLINEVNNGSEVPLPKGHLGGLGLKGRSIAYAKI